MRCKWIRLSTNRSCDISTSVDVMVMSIRLVVKVAQYILQAQRLSYRKSLVWLEKNKPLQNNWKFMSLAKISFSALLCISNLVASVKIRHRLDFSCKLVTHMFKWQKNGFFQLKTCLIYTRSQVLPRVITTDWDINKQWNLSTLYVSHTKASNARSRWLTTVLHRPTNFYWGSRQWCKSKKLYTVYVCGLPRCNGCSCPQSPVCQSQIMVSIHGPVGAW